MIRTRDQVRLRRIGEYRQAVVERSTGRVLGHIERDSYPTCRGGSEVVGWTAIAPNGKRRNETRLIDAVALFLDSSSLWGLGREGKRRA